MTYQEEKDFEKREQPRQQPEFMAFLEAITKSLPGNWEIRPDEERPPCWKYKSSFTVWVRDGLKNIRFDFEKHSMFAPVRSGRVSISAFCSHELSAYRSYNSKWSFEISLSLTKDIFRITAEIQSRLLPEFLKEYELRIQRREEQRAETKILWNFVERLRIASEYRLEIDCSESQRSEKRDEIHTCTFNEYTDSGAHIRGTVYKDRLDVTFDRVSPEKAEQFIRLFFS